jgi:ADP-ribose pyrophosphatase YjhB (NUDIX family)
MRNSEAALAWIIRVSANGTTQVLTQWSATWQAFSLIGGHREPNESFRECCIREIEEELQLCYPNDFLVSEEPICPPIQYVGFSKRARQKTQYYHIIFRAYTRLGDAFLNQSDMATNRWVSFEEIQRKRTQDDLLISEQVFHALQALESSCGLESKSLDGVPTVLNPSPQLD